jgi:hypothetical protein
VSEKELDAAGIRDPALRASYEACRRLNASHGKTYYLATLLLPAWKRPYVHALYGFARYADEIVDDLGSTLTDAQKADWLVGWGEQFVRDVEAGGSDHPISRAVVDTVRRWDIPMHYVEAFLASMRMDLTVTQYDTYDDLMTYVYGSAAVIGLEMVRSWSRSSRARWPTRTPATSASPSSSATSSATSARTCARAGLPADGGPAGLRRDARAPRARGRRRTGPPAAGLRGGPDEGALPQRRRRVCGCSTRRAGPASRRRSPSTAGSSTRSSGPTTTCWAAGSASAAGAVRRWPCPASPERWRPAEDPDQVRSGLCGGRGPRASRRSCEDQ